MNDVIFIVHTDGTLARYTSARILNMQGGNLTIITAELTGMNGSYTMTQEVENIVPLASIDGLYVIPDDVPVVAWDDDALIDHFASL